MPQAPPKKLLDQMRDVLRLKHYAIRTETAYLDCLRRFPRVAPGSLTIPRPEGPVQRCGVPPPLSRAQQQRICPSHTLAAHYPAREAGSVRRRAPLGACRVAPGGALPRVLWHKSV